MVQEMEKKQAFSIDYYFFTMIGMLAAIFEIFWASFRDCLSKIGLMQARDQDMYSYGETGSLESTSPRYNY